MFKWVELDVRFEEVGLESSVGMPKKEVWLTMSRELMYQESAPHDVNTVSLFFIQVYANSTHYLHSEKQWMDIGMLCVSKYLCATPATSLISV